MNIKSAYYYLKCDFIVLKNLGKWWYKRIPYTRLPFLSFILITLFLGSIWVTILIFFNLIEKPVSPKSWFVKPVMLYLNGNTFFHKTLDNVKKDLYYIYRNRNNYINSLAASIRTLL